MNHQIGHRYGQLNPNGSFVRVVELVAIEGELQDQAYVEACFGPTAGTRYHIPLDRLVDI